MTDTSAFARPSPLRQPRFENVATQALLEGRSLTEALLDACRRYATRPFVTNLRRTLSYAEVEARSADLAAYLRHDLGLARGARVAIMLPNLLQFPVVLLAVLRADLVAVPVNPLYTARELRHQLADSGAAALVVVANFGAIAAEALPGTSVRHVITTRVGDLLGVPKRWLVDFMLERVKKLVPQFRIDGAVALPAALARGARLPRVASQARADDLAQLQYTGGTTGVSKGAALAHAALLANVASAEQWVGERLKAGGEINVIPLPLYHIAAYTNLLYSWLHGVHSVLITNPRDIPALIRELAHWRPSLMSGVNTLFDALLNAPDLPHVDFSRLKLTIQGGTALRRATAERWQARTGCPVVEMYGLSETAAGVTVNRWDALNPVGSIGMAMPGAEVAVFDEHGHALDGDAAGEICVRGPHVTTGYWQRPEETRAAFFDGGWFRTGDIGRRDAQGYFWLS